ITTSTKPKSNTSQRSQIKSRTKIKQIEIQKQNQLSSHLVGNRCSQLPSSQHRERNRSTLLPPDVLSTARFVEVDIDTFELEGRVTDVLAGVVNAVLVADHFPELGSDLVSTLAALDVEDLSHFLAGIVDS
ncbi:unnamed protein product, partial [Brassica oleracea var. botrytis]